jgi:hypothetical protein
MMKLSVLFGLVLVVFGPEFDNGQPTFKIATGRTNDRVDVKCEKDNVTFLFRSPLGISNATIEREHEHWPEKVTIQLQLSGLEKLKLSTELHKIEATVSSHTGDVRLWKDGKEDTPLNQKSPFWMDVRILDRDGKPTKTIPLRDGYFEMRLPKMFFDGNPRSITVNWLDFYRN